MLLKTQYVVKGADQKKKTFFCMFLGFLIYVAGLIWICLNMEAIKMVVDTWFSEQAEEVYGWETHRDFHAASYLRPDRNTTIIVGAKVCPIQSPPNALVIVTSFPQNFDNRRAIRETWGESAMEKYNISVAFLLGFSEFADLNIKVRKENALHQDIIVEDFLDNLHNATIKSSMMLKWTSMGCQNAKFLMKTDDTALLIVSNLDELVRSADKVYSRSLIGKLMPVEKVVRDFTSRRYMPNYMYPHATYPVYLAGEGYLMSLENVHFLYRTILTSSLIHIEDIFVTGICAEKAGIPRTRNFRFYFIENDGWQLNCKILFQRNLILLSHNLTAFEMRNRHKELRNCQENKEESSSNLLRKTDL